MRKEKKKLLVLRRYFALLYFTLLSPSLHACTQDKEEREEGYVHSAIRVLTYLLNLL